MKLLSAINAPFKQRVVYEQREIELMCLDELRKNGLLPSEPEPIRIEFFLKKRFNLTPDYSRSLPEGVLGVTKFGSRGPDQMWVARELAEDSSAVSRRRVNSTLAHEVGHCLLHGYLFVMSGKNNKNALMREAPVGEIDFEKKEVLCRSSESQSAGYYDGRWWEWQADAMIGPLLMPSLLVHKLLKGHFGIGVPVAGSSVELSTEQRSLFSESMAQAFDVNPRAASVRLDKIGFTKPKMPH